MSDLIKEAQRRLELSRIYGDREIDAMATVARDLTAGIIIQVNPVGYRIGNEYFKVFLGKGYRASNKLARISFWKPSYITGHTNYGKEVWVLNAQEKKALVRLLKAKSNTLSVDGSFVYTNWQKTIALFNEELDFTYADTEANLMGTPNYNNRYLPFNLPMPNYLEL